MSHSVCLVLVDKKPQSKREATAIVEELLAPFSEHIEVEPYEEECYCVQSNADTAGCEAASKKHGPLKDIREKFNTETLPRMQEPMEAKYGPANKWYYDDVVSSEERDAELAAYEEVKAKAWKEAAGPYWETKESVQAAHPKTPDTDCDDCDGSGISTSTYNPKSKWDYWTLGGRWNGYLTDYDPRKNPNNFTICYLCGGTGKREDMEVHNGCNGCNGKGKKLKWNNEIPIQDSNIMPVASLPFNDEKSWKKYCPFAILTSDGEWHEKGDMGWWGCVSDEKEDWKEIARKIMEKNKDKFAIVCDLHI